MMIMMTAALAAAAPGVSATPGAEAQPQHMEMAGKGHDQKDCCDCCKDMAKKHEGHADHEGQPGR